MEISNNITMSYQGQGSSVTQNSSSKPVENTSQSSDTTKADATKVDTSATVPSGKAVISDSENQDDQNKVSDEQLKEAVDKINKNANGTEAIFGIHEATHRVMIKIVDKKTKEVIKEIPAEKTLDLIAKAWELAGLMVDEKR